MKIVRKSGRISTALSFVILSGCGGSGGSGNSESANNIATSKTEITTYLANSEWQKKCVPFDNQLSDEQNSDSSAPWNVNIKLTIDASLKANYKTEFFHLQDSDCAAMMFDTLDIARFEITDKVVSDESIAAFGLNQTLIYSSEGNSSEGNGSEGNNSEETAPKLNYTLIYLDTEKLYFGQSTGDNLGKTSQTRHSSISLDDYFTQIIN